MRMLIFCGWDVGLAGFERQQEFVTWINVYLLIFLFHLAKFPKKIIPNM